MLRFPAFAPVLRGFEPYTKLLRGVRASVAHPDAVLEFAYDWRLSVAHTAAELAKAVDPHLQAWRASVPRRRASGSVSRRRWRAGPPGPPEGRC